MTRILIRRYAANLVAAVGALAAAVSLSADTAPSVKFTDTKLKNGLRLIISEDHVAPTFSIAVVYNVPIACNRATADFVLSSPLMAREYSRMAAGVE